MDLARSLAAALLDEREVGELVATGAQVAARQAVAQEREEVRVFDDLLALPPPNGRC
jgi:hypothetical protein